MVVTQPVFLVYSIPDLDSPVRPFQETCFLCMDETRHGLMNAHGHQGGNGVYAYLYGGMGKIALKWPVEQNGSRVLPDKC